MFCRMFASRHGKGSERKGPWGAGASMVLRGVVVAVVWCVGCTVGSTTPVDAAPSADGGVDAGSKAPPVDMSRPPARPAPAADASDASDEPPPEPVCISNLPLQGQGPAPTYFKPSNTQTSQGTFEMSFGWALALSADAQTLAVGAKYECGGATGVNGEDNDCSVAGAGAVYVFRRLGSVWAQEAYIKTSNGSEAGLGWSVSLSANGDTLAVGAPRESGTSSGVNGSQVQDSSTDNSGAVFVYKRSVSGWAQEAYIKASNSRQGLSFGSELALSASGETLVVHALNDDGASPGIGAAQGAGSVLRAGAVHVFQKSASGWAQQVYIKAPLPKPSGYFGFAVAISGDGNVLVVGAPGGGAGGSVSDAYVYQRSGEVWALDTALVPAPHKPQGFGRALTVSTDGSIIAVASPNEPALPPQIDGGVVSTSGVGEGAVYLFAKVDGAWAHKDRVFASPPEAGQGFGHRRIALSANGHRLAVPATGDSSAATGLNGNPCDATVLNAGAVHLFSLNGNTWLHDAYVKAPNPSVQALFGMDVALSSDGQSLAVGAEYEESVSTGVNGNMWNSLAPGSGAAYVYAFR